MSFMLSHYAECSYDECSYAECHYVECRYAECHYAECRLCRASFMLNVVYAVYHYAECSNASVILMSVIMLSDDVLSFVAPFN